MRQRTSAMLVALAIVACSRGDDRGAPNRTAASTVDAAADRARLLLDSASTFLTRGDSASARRALAAANALASSDPELVYRVAVAQENVGDLGPAARAYRRYLSLAPSGVDAADASARLTALITGVPTSTQLASGETVAPPTSSGLSDPSIPATSASTSAPLRRPSTSRPTPRRSTALRVARAAAPARATTRVATAADAATGPVVAPMQTPPRVAVAEPTAAPMIDSAPTTAVATTTSMQPTMTPMEVPKIHYSRWSRMQSWFVAKLAGLGGTGGAVVGAIIGNVPGAIAIGLAGGAAGGLAKVHQDKVDSARALKMAARTVRDSSAGEVDLLLLPDTTRRDTVRHAGTP